MTRFLIAAIPEITSLVASWRADQERFQQVAHYPTAKNVIERMLAEKKKLKLEDLPYEKTMASLYARLYASENPKSSFDERRGVLTLGA
jgi:hypothetical protein